MDRDTIEPLLLAGGFVILQDFGNGLVYYAFNTEPGAELIIDWNGGHLTKEDMVELLKDEGLVPDDFNIPDDLIPDN